MICFVSKKLFRQIQTRRKESTSSVSLDILFLQVWYSNQMFDSMEHLVSDYAFNRIKKTEISFPSMPEKEVYSSLHLRGTPVPTEDQEMPRVYEPHGPRYKVTGRQSLSAGWPWTMHIALQ